MKLQEIREAFLNYFHEHGHTRVTSSSLVPQGDDTLLFTNAGMVPFKNRFLGTPGEYSRATSSQRCVRAGGKHNDLENVGYTARHHTFFEMLGNFSFGDYFKREAIEYAWNFLTKVLKIPSEKLWVTVYVEDDETAKLWLQDMKIDPERFSRCGEKDNFWSMGDTGPCGPCTEIFYDHGPEVAGGPPGTPEEDGDRYVEIWNLVFMQYNRDAKGNLAPLPKPSVDTGMGLERIAAVMQGVHSNYDIDLFSALIAHAAEILSLSKADSASLKVISDHIRAASFLITDGVLPSNEGRGYVLRRIIRRAIRHGHKLGAQEPFFYKMVSALTAQMGKAYPELVSNQKHIETVLKEEEKQFAKTLASGMRILETALQPLKKGEALPGETLFKLYDTYGFPVDLTADIARERDIVVDDTGFEKCMAEQRARAKAASQFDTFDQITAIDGETDFIGYTDNEAISAVEHILKNGEPASALLSGEEGVIVLDRTAFYAESGGQVGDTGFIESDEGSFEVFDTQKTGDAIVHVGRMQRGEFRHGSQVVAKIDTARRQEIRRHHSATHLLHAVLREQLGDHVQQKGSLVCPDYLRFDFSHPSALKPAQLEAISAKVNALILNNTEVKTELMTPEKAKAAGAMALFGEKYGKTVRVLSMGNRYSVELCGGTHVSRTADIGLFLIKSEAGIASGIRRIEALTGEAAHKWIAEQQACLAQTAALLKTTADKLPEKTQQLLQQVKTLEKDCEQLKGKLASKEGSSLASKAEKIGEVSILIEVLDGADPKSLRTLLDQLKQKLGTSAILLATVSGDRINLIAGVSTELTSTVSAKEWITIPAAQVGGKGGGRPDMAQAGGSDPAKLAQAMQAARDWLVEKLG